MGGGECARECWRGQTRSGTCVEGGKVMKSGTEVARGIEPPTCGLQNPSEANLPTQQAPDKIGKSLDGSQD